ncbi:DNA-3-methyladenine glycosylase [bacterium]|nr:DNA-3-methyladenine glycosylase [bacterium]
MPAKLPRSFYSRPTLEVAPDLLGKILIRIKGKTVTSGRIVEVEAYRNADDPASHAHPGKTPRNILMFGEAGHAYVYFIYGMYFCVNVVTEKTGTAGACLIRALEPLDGIGVMKKRRHIEKTIDLANGPGKLCQSMSVDLALNGEDYLGNKLFIVDDGYVGFRIKRSPRIGIRYAVDKRWRFFIQGNSYVTRNKFNDL